MAQAEQAQNGYDNGYDNGYNNGYNNGGGNGMMHQGLVPSQLVASAGPPVSSLPQGPAWYCAVCEVQCKNGKEFEQHNAGRKHVQTLRRVKGGPKSLSEIEAAGTMSVEAPPPPPVVEASRQSTTAAGKKKIKRRQHHNAPDLKPPVPPVGGGMGPMEDQRRGLPVFSFRESLLETMDANDVIVVEGETGSGE